jgi:hypothetical protein
MKKIRKEAFKYSDDKIQNGEQLITFGKYKDLLTFSDLYE